MVTAEIIEGKPGIRQEYPCLKTDPNTGLVIFLIAYDEGFVVAQGDDEYPMGDYGKGWNEDSLEIFTGSVTLRNE